MLGIDLGRLRQRLGLLQRRLEGLERGAPPSVSNTVPHATETSLALSIAASAGSPATRADAECVAQVEAILTAQRTLLKGRRPDVASLEEIARSLVADVERRGGLLMAPVPTSDPAFNRARHSLEFGRATAFLAVRDERLQSTAVPLIAASLLADATLLNMIGLEETVAREQAIEHGEEAARLLHRTGSLAPSLVEAVAYHHARLDGSGAPSVRSQDFSAEARLLTVAAAYLDQRWPRTNDRLADPRRALREVLLEAESAKLDLSVAFRLLDVSFYPMGTVVELSGGETAEVVATQRITSDLELASLPIVRLLRDSDGAGVDEPIYWNLAQRPGSRIVRTVSRAV
jgi:hypothetical protein